MYIFSNGSDYLNVNFDLFLSAWKAYPVRRTSVSSSDFERMNQDKDFSVSNKNL